VVHLIEDFLVRECAMVIFPSLDGRYLSIAGETEIYIVGTGNNPEDQNVPNTGL
jgi:hypothetical protein